MEQKGVVPEEWIYVQQELQGEQTTELYSESGNPERVGQKLQRIKENSN